MDVPEDNQSSEFVFKVDQTPIFWAFLNDLDRKDLFAELVQNDLDQGATRTIISFEKTQMTCEGNGKPIDAAGWARLTYIQGAGDEVVAKQGGVGVKNHGLKVAFTIGDEIRILSDAKEITQTLYKHGRDRAPSPGAHPEARENPQPPFKGCRIIVTYRDKDLMPQEGEAITLGAVSEQDIENLFKSACSRAPEQFAGIISPDSIPQYELVLRHWRLGEALFVFSCIRATKIPKHKRMKVFRRHCKVSGDVPDLPADLHERAVRRLHP
ncbi:MAG: hypothetical protein OD811_04840, partial [Alphaproteobacteria bacterium]